MTEDVQPSVVRFGSFELDLRTHELKRAGITQKLNGHPVRILELLLRSPGRLVTRDELRQELWPRDTFVDFEHGLNAAVKRLRAALGDSADTPRFVETLPRRGYRFTAEVVTASPSTVVIPAPALPSRRRRMAMAVGLAVGVLTAVGGWAIWQGRRQVSSPAMRVTSLTGFHGYEMMPTLSPDGEQVAFAGNSDTENVDIHVTIIGSHTARRITTDPAIEYFPSWSPDGKQIAFIRRVDDESGHVYLTTPLGGGERRLSDFPVTFDGYGAFGQISWSPDGRSIAAAPAYPLREGYRSTGIYLLPLRGGDPRLLTHASAPATHRDPAFSPDGRQLA